MSLSPAGRALFGVASALAVILASFWITLWVLDHWTPADPNTDLIDVAEATYGLNCQGSVGPGGQVNQVKAGNATAAIAKLCTKARDRCSFVVDVAQIGDPAPGCAKDMSVGWRCGANQAVNQLHRSGEANGQTVSLSCPAP